HGLRVGWIELQARQTFLPGGPQRQWWEYRTDEPTGSAHGAVIGGTHVFRQAPTAYKEIGPRACEGQRQRPPVRLQEILLEGNEPHELRTAAGPGSWRFP